MQKKEAIIFDFDGVIIDSFEACYEISSKIFNNLNKKDYRDFFRGNIYNVRREPDNMDVDFFTEYEKDVASLQIESDVLNFLKELSNKYSLFISSSTITELLEKSLVNNDASDLFSGTLGGDVEKDKTKKFRMIEDVYGHSIGQSIFVTDTLGDVLEANKIGIDTVGITSGYHPKEYLEEGKVIGTIEKLPELKKFI